MPWSEAVGMGNLWPGYGEILGMLLIIHQILAIWSWLL